MLFSKLVAPGLVGLTNVLLMVRCWLAAIKYLPRALRACPRALEVFAPDSSCCWLKYLPQAVWAASACFWHCGHEMLTPCALGVSCWKYLPLVRRAQGAMKCLPLATQAPGAANMKCLPLAYWAQGTIECLPWYCRHQALLMPPARHFFFFFF